jgi:hypothetical protein
VAWKMELAMAGVLLAVPDVVSFSGGTWRRQHAHSGGQQFRLHTKTPGQARGRLSRRRRFASTGGTCATPPGQSPESTGCQGALTGSAYCETAFWHNR